MPAYCHRLVIGEAPHGKGFICASVRSDEDDHDIFSHSPIYSAYRPRYPSSLFEQLATASPRRGTVWDCGTGNGQAAVGLAEHFARVYATDVNEQQIFLAFPHANVEYHVEPAHACSLQTETADLVTVAEALHWFNNDDFYEEVQRVSRRDGVFAAWSYGSCRVDPKLDSLIDYLKHNVLRDHWAKAASVDDVTLLHIPFRRISVQHLRMEAIWSVDDFLGYLRSWSAVAACVRKLGEDPIQEIERDARVRWGGHGTRTASWPMALWVGEVHGKP